MEREIDGAIRYLRITPITDPDTKWEFGIVLGNHRSPNVNDDYDGRRGGSFEYVVRIVEYWLAALGDWDHIPSE